MLFDERRIRLPKDNQQTQIEQEAIRQLATRWNAYTATLLAELQLHLASHGITAATHITSILERHAQHCANWPASSVSYPVQAELQLHGRNYGYDAESHARSILSQYARLRSQEEHA